MFSKIVAELDKKVVRMLFESYGITKNCESYIESTRYLLRHVNYDIPKTKETSTVFPSHTDKTFTTILYPNQISGLEFQIRDGQWITLELPPSSFVVLAGEACRGWSNDRVLAPIHKVVLDINGSETRSTIGLFTFIKDDKIIEVAEELVDEEHQLKFKPFVHSDLIKFFATERGSSWGRIPFDGNGNDGFGNLVSIIKMSKFNGLGISLGKGSFIGFAIEKVVVPGLPDDQRKKGRISDHRIREMGNVFLNNDGIVTNPSISKETRLARADESMHVRFQPISNDLGDNFLLNVADPNGSEVP
ncbi:hypothetical protein BC332_16414 [Capsicum chinense]|nr:hypothetical protein BC332_16414 [Capsicum chinense]